MPDQTIALPCMSFVLPDSFAQGDEDVTAKFARLVTDIAKALIVSDGGLAAVANVLGWSPHDRGQMMHHSILLGPLLHNESQKEILAAWMPHLLEQMHAFCVVTVSESWVLQGKPGATYEDIQAEYRKYGSVADHPDRIEVVTVLTETRQRTFLASFPILRDERGTVTGLGEDHLAGAGGECQPVRSRFSNWLQPKPKELH